MTAILVIFAPSTTSVHFYYQQVDSLHHFIKLAPVFLLFTSYLWGLNTVHHAFHLYLQIYHSIKNPTQSPYSYFLPLLSFFSFFY